MTALYGMVNVPSAVWIDEEGLIVRPPEVAYSKKISFGGLVVGDDRYVEGLRDWVERGSASPFAFSSTELSPKLKSKNPRRPQADVHFKLAVFLHSKGDAAGAARHWQLAQDLAPDNWNYHRQQWAFDPDTQGTKWRAKFDGLEGQPYYEPADLPEAD